MGPKTESCWGSYLQQPESEFVIQQNIKSQYFKAGTRHSVVGEASMIVMFDNRMCCYQGFNNNIFYIQPHLVDITAMLLHVLIKRGELPRNNNNENW